MTPIGLAAIVTVLGAMAPAAGAPKPQLPPDASVLEPFKGAPGRIADHLGAINCAALTTLALPHGRVVSSEVVSGDFTPPGWPAPITGLPEFCRVVAEATPTPSSMIGIEVWVPTSTYDGRYLQVGNGGFSGSVVYQSLAEGIRRGHATASTDDGSQAGGSGSFVLGQPEKLVDYGHRSLKETADTAKAVIRALKGSDPVYSYFHGCSNGGRQALMVAQRYPDEFDGVAAGAPANNFTRQFAAFAYNATRLLPAGSLVATPESLAAPPGGSPAAYITPSLPPTLAFHISLQALTQCAGRDGGLPGDRFLTNPQRCSVDLAALSCSSAGADAAACLTDPQRALVRAIYDGPRTSDTGEEIYPGLEPGGEWHPFNWMLWLTGHPSRPPAGFQALFGAAFFKYFVYGDPAFNIHNLAFTAEEIASLDSALGETLNAVNPDLSAFRARGGKLLHYHGFDDAAVAPRNSINYWLAVRRSMPAGTDGFYRLFMAPGLGHCYGGPGLNSFGNAGKADPFDADHDLVLALQRWVEEGVAPERIIARHVPEGIPGDTAFSRPLCPYPALPRYAGTGDSALAANWLCATPNIRLKIPPKFRNRPRLPDWLEPPILDDTRQTPAE
ncbi:MAG: tannase/feruloyl esterase family alpha/beta hydrolase [Parvularculaceae bacterium]|nr:tannase/feruloyl esterase family alpha/beta hydrolase [Parvularculaceae bacterium]